MRQTPSRWIASAALAVLLLATPGMARAGKLSWLDDVVQEVVREAEAGGKVAARGADDAIQAGKTGGRLFVREAADEGLDVVARRAEGLARAGTKAAGEPSEALLKSRFDRLVTGSTRDGPDVRQPRPGREAAGRRDGRNRPTPGDPLPRPGRADDPRAGHRGTDGRPRLRRRRGRDPRQGGFGRPGRPPQDGPERLGLLHTKVLPNKGKLAAAGVLGLYLADPDKFVDTAGRATKYAVEQFARAGLSLAGAVGDATVRGLGGSFGSLLASWGIGPATARAIGIGAAVLVVALSLMVLLGAPIRWIFRPFGWIGADGARLREDGGLDFAMMDRRREWPMIADIIAEDRDGRPILVG